MAKKFKAILPKRFKSEEMISELAKGIQKQTDNNETEYKKTYRTWKHKPSSSKDVQINRDEILGFILINSNPSKRNPYPFVHSGTRVRYATMTPDFSPKTKPRIINSTSGRGGLLFVSKKHPKPGIKAREFTSEIKDQQEPKFQKLMEKSMKSAAKKSGHKI